MTIRTNLNPLSSQRLLRVMNHYGYTSTNHTLNVIISSLYQALFEEQHTPEIEVETSATKKDNLQSM